MRTAVIFAEGVKQIIFTPENKDEEFALSLISTNDDIELLIQNGQFGEDRFKPFQASVGKCNGGYLRLFSDDKSKILILTPKKKEEPLQSGIIFTQDAVDYDVTNNNKPEDK